MRSDTAVFNRPDTLLGVCEAIGQDFHFNPLYLRIAFAVSVIWNPVAIIAAYLTLAVGVFLSRVLFPDRRIARSLVAERETSHPIGGNDDGVQLATEAA